MVNSLSKTCFSRWFHDDLRGLFPLAGVKDEECCRINNWHAAATFVEGLPAARDVADGVKGIAGRGTSEVGKNASVVVVAGLGA